MPRIVYTGHMFTVESRTHASCRDCDYAQRRAVTYAETHNLNGATGVIEHTTPKGNAREHVVMVKRAGKK